MGKLFWSLKDSFTSDDVNALANQIRERGLDDNASFSSSMDFANEYGFKNNKDAKDLFFKAVELSKTKPTHKPTSKHALSHTHTFLPDPRKLSKSYK